MTTVSILQAWRRQSELVARAWCGKEFGITRPGEDLARREPLEALNASGQASALAARIRASRAGSAAGPPRVAEPVAEQVAEPAAGQGGRTPLRDMVELGRRQWPCHHGQMRNGMAAIRMSLKTCMLP